MSAKVNFETWGAKELFKYFISHSKKIIFISTVGFLSSVLYSLSIPNIYSATAYIVAAEQSSSELSGGIASSLSSLGLGNISVGNKGSVNIDKARLKSREFLTSFINKHDLLPKLFYKNWDIDKKEWKSSEEPTLIEAYELLESRIAIFGPTPLNEIIFVSVDWYDPILASDWTNMLIEEVNLDARNRKKEEIEQSLYFIQQELQKANLAEIKFSLNELIKSQLRESILANVKIEYSFRFIDHAIPPTKKSSPNRTIIVIIGTLLSFAISIFYLIFQVVINDKRKIDLFNFD